MMDVDMEQAVSEQEAPWSPFPVTSETYDEPGVRKLVLRFPSKASLDQCLASLRAASARRMGPYAGPFGELLDCMERCADVVSEYESGCSAGGGRYYTEDGADCATFVTEDDAAALVRYLMDLVLLMDADLAFGNEEG